MRKENYNSSQLTDSQIREIFGGIKPSYRIEEAWLDEQRARLEGAIQVAEIKIYRGQLISPTIPTRVAPLGCIGRTDPGPTL